MASGDFTQFPLTDIVVDRDVRQRRELTGIEDLAESFTRVGQLHPIIIDRDGKLIAGERRYTAATALGWSTIAVQFTDELDPTQLMLIELEENIRRENLTWQDECRAVKAYHELRATEEDWTQERTASALGSSEAWVRQRLTVSEALEEGNEKIASIPKFSTALGVVQRSNERKRTSTLNAITLDDETPEEEVVPKAPILNVAFEDWLAEYEGPKFNFLHCDFPYGIDADGQQQGNNVALYGAYDDGPEVYYSLLDTLETAMDTTIAESAHLMFWFSMDFYQYTFDRLTKMGWKVNPFPLVWHKSDNTGLLPDPKRGPRRIYETAFFASRGDRQVVQAVSNLVPAPGREKTLHMSEKPVEMLTRFMRMAVDEYSLVLDPTCGSANALKAAEALGANTVLGLEKSEDFYERAVEHYYD